MRATRKKENHVRRTNPLFAALSVMILLVIMVYFTVRWRHHGIAGFNGQTLPDRQWLNWAQTADQIAYVCLNGDRQNALAMQSHVSDMIFAVTDNANRDITDVAYQDAREIFMSSVAAPLKRASACLIRAEIEPSTATNRLRAAADFLRIFALRCRVSACIMNLDPLMDDRSSPRVAQGSSIHVLNHIVKTLDEVRSKSASTYAMVAMDLKVDTQRIDALLSRDPHLAQLEIRALHFKLRSLASRIR